MKASIAEKIMQRLPDTLRYVEDYARETMDIRNLLREKMQQLDELQFEALIRPAFEQDEWILIAVGAALGFVMGEAQALVLEHFAPADRRAAAAVSSNVEDVPSPRLLRGLRATCGAAGAAVVATAPSRRAAARCPVPAARLGAPGGRHAAHPRRSRSTTAPTRCSVPASRCRTRSRAPCSFGCGQLPVPLDYRHPDGASIRLSVIRIHTTQNTTTPVQSLLVNPGGPGGGGLDFGLGPARPALPRRHPALRHRRLRPTRRRPVRRRCSA